MTGNWFRSRAAFIIVASVAGLFIAGATSAYAADGKTVYDGNGCKTCHGPDGKGNPKIAEMFKVDPAKLDLTSSGTTGKTDAQLTKSIRDGVDGSKMKGYKDKLSGDDVSAVVKYIRSLKK